MGLPELLSDVGEKIASGETTEAFRTLRAAVDYPAPLLGDEKDFSSAFALFAQLAQVFSGDELAEKMKAVAQRPDHTDALYEAAYLLYEHRLHGPAATLLARANRLLPGTLTVVSELVSNLEPLIRYEDAVKVLDDSGLIGQEEFITYLSGFSNLMCGDIFTAEERLSQLANVTKETSFMRDELAGMVARYHALTKAKIHLGDHALTAWHAIINGTLLLHESQHGYGEPMRGRYAYLGDSPERMKEGIDRLAGFLRATGKRPTRVVSAPDRASHILALAVARVLKLPLEKWTPEMKSMEGLFVVWNMGTISEMDFLKALHVHVPDQILFVHASAWVEPFIYSPDITTFLFQMVTHPYTGGALKADDTGKMVRQPPDTRSDEALAEEILNTAVSDPSATSAEFVVKIAAALVNLPESQRLEVARQSGNRRTERAGSPVKSNRFT